LTAVGNIVLTAGDDPTPGASNPASSLFGNANAQSFVKGFVAVPGASASTTLASNTTLTINKGVVILSGGNAKLAADSSKPSASATGIGHGTSFALLGIPISYTNGDSSTLAPTSSSVTVNGDVTAGYLHELNITIPDAKNAGGFYSSTVT